ncbi:MAG: 50S ribosomal protein L25/general stress protein Ctc [Alphaproteobacteria bacterium]
MSKALTIKAVVRSGAGKGVARAERRAGRVPCVIYGGKEVPSTISIESRILEKYAHHPRFLTTLIHLDLDVANQSVLAKAVQFHPVTDRPIHVDFFRVSDDTLVEIEVPVEFLNAETCPGIKRGGVLNIVRHGVSLKCPAGNIPEKITINLASAVIGDSFHLSSITLPEGTQPVLHGEKDVTIATIAAPSGADA